MGAPYLTFKQSAYVSVAFSNPSVAFASNTTAGSLLLCLVATFTTAVAPTTVSDTVNGTWTPIGSVFGGPVGNCRAFYFDGSAGGVKPTVSTNGNGQVANLFILEFTGQNSTSGQLVDTSSYIAGATSTPGPFTNSLISVHNNSAAIGILITSTASNWTLGGTPTPTPAVSGPASHQAAITQLANPGSSASISYTADRNNIWSFLFIGAFTSNQTTYGIPNSLMMMGCGT